MLFDCVETTKARNGLTLRPPHKHKKRIFPRQSEILFSCHPSDNIGESYFSTMRVQEHAVKASSLMGCTEVNTSTFGTTTIEHAYELQRTISNFGTIKADEIFKPTTKTTPGRRSKDLRSIQEWKRDINYLASGLARADHQSHDQQTISYARKTAGQLSSCLNYTWFNVSKKKARGHTRCKSHACPFCVHKKQQQRIKDFCTGIDNSSIKAYEYDYLSLVTIVFTNKTRHHLDMRSQLQRLNKGGVKTLEIS